MLLRGIKHIIDGGFSQSVNEVIHIFSIWIFFHEHSQITGRQGRGEDISLTPHYHFYRFTDI